MIGFLTRWLEQRRRRRAAVEAAVRHFNATTGNRAHAAISRVIGEDAGKYIVRVCYGDCKPPGRKWFVVEPNGLVVGVLTFEQAREFGERLTR